LPLICWFLPVSFFFIPWVHQPNDIFSQMTSWLLSYYH